MFRRTLITFFLGAPRLVEICFCVMRYAPVTQAVCIRQDISLEMHFPTQQKYLDLCPFRCYPRYMSAKKTTKSKVDSSKDYVRVNISLTRGTDEVLKKLAEHKHITVSAALTCLIRKTAEEVGILSPIATNVVPPITALPTPQKKKNGTQQ